MRIADDWVSQVVSVTAVLALLLLGAVVWGRHFQAPWNTPEAVQVATMRGQEVARPATVPAPERPNPAIGKAPDVQPADAGRAQMPEVAQAEEKAPATSMKREKPPVTDSGAGISAARNTPLPDTGRQEPSWLSLFPD